MIPDLSELLSCASCQLQTQIHSTWQRCSKKEIENATGRRNHRDNGESNESLDNRVQAKNLDHGWLFGVSDVSKMYFWK